ncbi:MAG: VIT family protein [Nitriliruptoraceae bacterium]
MSSSSSSQMHPTGWHDGEQHDGSTVARLNWLRAGVLGANDGIVSTAALVVGVAAATSDVGAIATAGTAGLLAGAVSMALGEYVSVSTQRDTERALIAKETDELKNMPAEELAELTQLLQAKGLSFETARAAAVELTANDALAAHLDIELGIDRDDLVSPWAAAFASAVAFSAGAILPLGAILLSPVSTRVGITYVSVMVALIVTGALSARLGGSPLRPAIIRLVTGGTLAMALTFGIGALFNANVS